MVQPLKGFLVYLVVMPFVAKTDADPSLTRVVEVFNPPSPFPQDNALTVCVFGWQDMRVCGAGVSKSQQVVHQVVACSAGTGAYLDPAVKGLWTNSAQRMAVEFVGHAHLFTEFPFERDFHSKNILLNVAT